ncbi:MAG: glycosyltransferase, partial [Porphyromonadaceae bacterium]|nr:glycosyltransferase [Porphyromonadaceae bacterium]
SQLTAHSSADEQHRHIVILLNEVAKGGVTSVIKNTIVRLIKLGVRVSMATMKLDHEAISPEYFQSQDVGLLIFPSELEDASKKLITYVHEHSVNLVICLGLWDIHPLANKIKENTSAKIANWRHMMPFYNKNLDKSKAHTSLKAFLKYYLIKLPFVYTLGYRDTLKEQNMYIIQSYDYLIVLCSEYKDELITALHLDETQAKKIIPLINTIDINPNPELNKRKEIAYAGRFHNEDKRLTDLLRVWQRIAPSLPEWTLKLYGSGIDEEFLRSFAQERELQRVEFVGYTQDMQAVYDRTSIICLTSVIEGWPMMLIEAQNNGVIPISYNCAASIASIIGKGAGKLIKDGDIAKFARELLTLAQNEDERQRLQTACLEKRLDYAPDINDDTWRTLLNL